MNREEILDELEKIAVSQPALADSMYERWKEDPTRSLETLRNLASLDFKSKDALETGKIRSPMMDAFGLNEDQYRRLIDPNSKNNWMTLPTKEIWNAAVKGGYVDELPLNASEEEKLENRKKFGQFVNQLAMESTLQGRRNAIREYENVRFGDHPLDWTAGKANDLFFHTFSKRAKEQAMRGEGPSGWSEMSPQDAATLGGDIAVNTMLGAGAGGIGRSLWGRGVGEYAGLRTAGNVLGSDVAAGVLGGLGSVANRSVNTEEGVQPYEYVTEPALTGGINAIATPAVLREGVGNAARLLGIGGAKVDGAGKGSLMRYAQKVADQKYAEPALASRLKELQGAVDMTYDNSPVSEATKVKVGEMFDVLNDGISSTPGKSTSLFDELQSLYEKSGREGTNLRGDVSHIFWGSSREGAVPIASKFRYDLDKKIADIEGELANSAGKSEMPELQRELNYFKNFRDLMDNNLIDAEKYLHNTDPVRVNTPKSNYVLTDKSAEVPMWELGKKPSQSDIDFIKDYVDNLNRGKNIRFDNGIATRMKELMDKYPEFNRYVTSQTQVPANGMDDLNTWVSLGSYKHLDPNNPNMVSIQPLVTYTETPYRSYGHPSNVYGSPDRSVGEVLADAVEFGKLPVFAAKERVKNIAGSYSAGDILRAGLAGGREVVEDVAKPAVVNSRLAAFDRPDNSLEALTVKYEKLRARKPEAVDAAIGFKFDPRLEPSKQLTAEERDLIDRYREAQRKALLGE